MTFASYAQQNATIVETSLKMPTYPFSDADRVPQPDEDYYPYFRFDGFAKEPVEKEWKAIILENEYIKVFVFPEIGGKIWGAIEKSTGNEFIYYNSVVKFRDIAMRGAWVSGGIELNFGIIGHAPTSATPVDYTIKENEDGSASCYVAATDHFTRTRWETEINLPNDKAFFTTKTTWHNPTPLVQPYYQWMNAAYQVEGDLEFCFPGSTWIGHDGGAHSWPIDPEGRDRSWYKNNSFGGSKSNHVLGGISDHYAGYWHDMDFGSGHYSPYGEKLGMKVFQWAHSRSGGIWEDLLTDTDGQYVELQSGRLFNQAVSSSTRTPFKHHGFEPYATDVFQEYWFPIKDTKGVKKANPYGVINVQRSEDGLSIYFCPLQPTQESISIYAGEKLLKEVEMDLDPLQTRTILLKAIASDAHLKVVVGDDLLTYSDNPADNKLNRPMEAPEDFDWNSTYGLYLAGVQWIYQKKYTEALSSLTKCLEEDAYYAPALNEISMLYYRKGDFNNALDYARKSLSINAYDAQANIAYGMINKAMGQLLDAQDGFSVASLTPSYRNAAHIELSKLGLLRSNLRVAEMYALKVLESNRMDLEANKLMAVISRKQNNAKEAQRYQSDMAAISVLNHYSNFENFLLKQNDNAKDEFLKELQSEMPHETLLEMAQWYESLGAIEESINLLKMAEPHALVSYKLAYLYSQTGNEDQSKAYLGKASLASPDFIFPFRVENLEVLNWAVKQSADWQPKYYLGLLNWGLGNKDIAERLFNQCGSAPNYPYFYLAKSTLFEGHDDYNPEQDLQKARSLGPEEWRAAERLINFYLGKNQVEEALAIAELSISKFADNDIIKYVYAKCLIADKQYTACKKALATTTILPNEGARYGKVTYQQACLMEAMTFYEKGKYEEAIESSKEARLWPENLGVGKPFDVDDRIEEYFEAICLLANGERKEGKQLLQEIVDSQFKKNAKYTAADFVYLKALEHVNRRDEAIFFLNNWAKQKPDDPVQKWCSYMLEKNYDEAQAIAGKINTESGGTPWDPVYADPDFQLVQSLGILLAKEE